MTDIYAFFRMIAEWAPEKHGGVPGCDRHQKNVIHYAGANHTDTIALLLSKYYGINRQILVDKEGNPTLKIPNQKITDRLMFFNEEDILKHRSRRVSDDGRSTSSSNRSGSTKK